MLALLAQLDPSTDMARLDQMENTMLSVDIGMMVVMEVVMEVDGTVLVPTVAGMAVMVDTDIPTLFTVTVLL